MDFENLSRIHLRSPSKFATVISSLTPTESSWDVIRFEISNIARGFPSMPSMSAKRIPTRSILSL